MVFRELVSSTAQQYGQATIAEIEEIALVELARLAKQPEPPKIVQGEEMLDIENFSFEEQKAVVEMMVKAPGYKVRDWQNKIKGSVSNKLWKYIQQQEAKLKGREQPNVREGHPLKILPKQVKQARVKEDWAAEVEAEAQREKLVGTLKVQQQKVVDVYQTPEGPLFKPAKGVIHLVDAGVRFEGRELIYEDRGVQQTWAMTSPESVFYVLRKAKNVLFSRKIPGPIRFELFPRETLPKRQNGENRSKNTGGRKPPKSYQQKQTKK